MMIEMAQKRLQLLDECFKYFCNDCVGCPLENDETAWCRHYLLRDVPDDQLDTILNKFKEAQA